MVFAQKRIWNDPFYITFFLLLTLALLYTKWTMINYGLPFQIHVDEATILKDPFKIILNYTHGDFQSSTNLYNWIILSFFCLIFILGLISGKWSGFDEFKSFLISDSPEFLLYGRFLSMVISILASYILVKLIFKITTDKFLRVIFSITIFFNPVELNAVNWVKFDALAYLAYAVILYLSYDYFILTNIKRRWLLYVALIASLSIRIELISYLVGFFTYDLYLHRNTLLAFFKSMFKPSLIGLAIYSLVTLYPLKLFYVLFFKPSLNEQSISTSPTFENAIASKISLEGLAYGLKQSDFYVYALFALLGPVAVIISFLSYKYKEYRFLYLPLTVMAIVLIVFPTKGTHYLLNVSLLILFTGFLFLNRVNNNKVKWLLASVSMIWIFTFSINQLRLAHQGDVRIPAKDFLMNNTSPNDLIYVDGVFSQISDKPSRYKLKSEAAKLVGSTGLSNEYFAKNLKDVNTRVIKTVSSYDAFLNTPYQNVFNNNYDDAALTKDKPKYYIYVSSNFEKPDFRNDEHYQTDSSFYKIIEENYRLEKEFEYSSKDPRIKYATSYYFRPVAIYHIK